jgi:hypothetical protein
MTVAEAAFLGNLAYDAQQAGEEIGWWPSVVLAQWADETDWGQSPAFVNGHNLAGVSPGGVIASYPSIAAGLAAYIGTARSDLYDPVRAAKPLGPSAQALALGRSDWATGKYIAEGSSTPGSALVALIADNDLTRFDPEEELLDMTPGMWVRALYELCLGREPDPGAYATDTAALSAGTQTVEGLYVALLESPEGVAYRAARPTFAGRQPLV